MDVVLADESTYGFPNIASVNKWPDLLSLDNAIICMQDNQCCQVTLFCESNGIAITVQFT